LPKKFKIGAKTVKKGRKTAANLTKMMLWEEDGWPALGSGLAKKWQKSAKNCKKRRKIVKNCKKSLKLAPKIGILAPKLGKKAKKQKHVHVHVHGSFALVLWSGKKVAKKRQKL